MKRLLFFGAIPFFGCADSFFVTIDLGLDTRDLNLLAVDIAEVRQIEVLATPSDDTEPQSFVIENIPRFPPEGFISYALELPKDLETIPLQLDHRAFSVDPNITEPFLFGTVSVATEDGQRSGLVLSARDPKCNNGDDGGEFCFGFPIKGNISVSHENMIATDILLGNAPLVMISSNSTNSVRAFTVSTGGLTENSNFSLAYPLNNVALTDMAILDSDNGAQFFTVALLQNAQIFVRLPNGQPGPEVAAPGVRQIIGASLNVLPGRDIAAITNNSVQFFLNNTGASGFDAPINFPLASGNPKFIERRRAGNSEQVVVAIENPAQIRTFDLFNNSIRPLGTIDLPQGTIITGLAIADINGDGNEDAIIAADGPTRRVFVALQDNDGGINTLDEIPVSGNSLRAVAVGRFDNNASLDIAVSGTLGGDFTQFILSDPEGPKVTAPRAVGIGPNVLLPLKLATPGQADSLLVETTNETSLDIMVPEL